MKKIFTITTLAAVFATANAGHSFQTGTCPVKEASGEWKYLTTVKKKGQKIAVPVGHTRKKEGSKKWIGNQLEKGIEYLFMDKDPEHAPMASPKYKVDAAKAVVEALEKDLDGPKDDKKCKTDFEKAEKKCSADNDKAKKGCKAVSGGMEAVCNKEADEKLKKCAEMAFLTNKECEKRASPEAEMTKKINKIGAVWRYVIEVSDTCEKGWQVNTKTTVITNNKKTRPCCTPGNFANPKKPNGSCKKNTPSFCDKKKNEEEEEEKALEEFGTHGELASKCRKEMEKYKEEKCSGKVAKAMINCQKSANDAAIECEKKLHEALSDAEKTKETIKDARQEVGVCKGMTGKAKKDCENRIKKQGQGESKSEEGESLDEASKNDIEASSMNRKQFRQDRVVEYDETRPNAYEQREPIYRQKQHQQNFKTQVMPAAGDEQLEQVEPIYRQRYQKKFNTQVVPDAGNKHSEKQMEEINDRLDEMNGKLEALGSQNEDDLTANGDDDSLEGDDYLYGDDDYLYGTDDYAYGDDYYGGYGYDTPAPSNAGPLFSLNINQENVNNNGADSWGGGRKLRGARGSAKVEA